MSGAGPSRIRALVVEDDTTSRKLLRRALERTGCEVFESASGEEGVERFASEQPDVVWMDIGLPGIDGYEATRRIKLLSGDRFTPVIFLTAETDDALLARCVEVGGDDFLTKPFSKVLLYAKLDALIRIRSLYRTVQQQRDEIERFHARLQEEQRVAEKLFQRMMRSAGGALPGVRKLLSPMSIFNGDLLLVAPTPWGGIRAMLGDFTGHGLSAAMGALPLSDIFYGMTRKGFSLADLALEANRKLRRVLPTGLFCACVMIDTDPLRGQVTVWNGGVPDLLVRGGDGGLRHRIRSTHLPLAIVGDDEFDVSVETFAVSAGERLYAYSDGLIEARGADGSLFGSERIEQLIDGEASNEAVFDAICKSISVFRGGEEQNDDLTLLELELGDALGVADAAAAAEAPERAPMPWRTVIELGPEALRTVDPVPLAMQGLLEIQALQKHREKLYLVIAELFSNALEHGVLGLDSALKAGPDGFRRYYEERTRRLDALESGFVRLECEHIVEAGRGLLSIRLSDSGRGFGAGATGTSLGSNEGRSGRGIALVRSICDDVRHLDDGRVVEAIYRWPRS